jgi:catechol 2,3-dioxygenase-like lactoylglutathione lyase family enzyme
MTAVSVRYIVDDVDAAIAFYTERLGFTVELHPAPGFAMLSGGWNRIQLQVDDLDREVQTLRDAGAQFRNDIVTGFGGKQILLDDPAGNPVELFEPPPARDE